MKVYANAIKLFQAFIIMQTNKINEFMKGNSYLKLVRILCNLQIIVGFYISNIKVLIAGLSN